MGTTNSVTDPIGDTPLLRINRLTGPDDADHPAVKEAAIRAAKNEGLLMGMSVAAILHIAVQKAEGLGKGKRIVAVLPDDGMKHLSTDFYDSE